MSTPGSRDEQKKGEIIERVQRVLEANTIDFIRRPEWVLIQKDMTI